jgi:DNA-binding protein HU-beta
MNKKELIDAVAAKTGAPRTDADRVAAALIEVISDTLKRGDSVSLPGFGTFEVRERPAYTGRNPRTEQPLQIAASKIPAFKPGASLKTAVKAEK